MSEDPQIDELLAAWEEAQGSGQILAACRNSVSVSELLEPLRRRIQKLQAIAPVLGRIEADGTICVVWSSPEPIAPRPFPATRSPGEWESFLEQLYQGWGNRWANLPA
jgi:hypothetical protein